MVKETYYFIKNATNLIREYEIDEIVFTQTGLFTLERNFSGITKLEFK